MHCSRGSQVWISANFSLKLGPTALFIHLKIIFLQCFQFSVISGIQINPKYNIYVPFKKKKTYVCKRVKPVMSPKNSGAHQEWALFPMVGRDGWRPYEKKPKLIFHVPRRERAHYRAMPCAEGSPGAVGEGRASQGVLGQSGRSKCRSRVRKSKQPSSPTSFGNCRGHSCNLSGHKLE